ncbi:MAG: DsbE family thiol:disulfide interchange protein [Geminicoccales bacterium]
MTGTASPDTGKTGSHTGATSSVAGTANPEAGPASTASPGAGPASSYGRLGYLLPVIVFLVIGAGLGIGLTRDPSTLPSALIDKPVPTFELPALVAGGIDKPGLASADLTGKVQLVNVFASWCGPCRVEHPILMGLAKDGVPVQALNYKDQPEDAAGFLNQLGDPYEKIGVDQNGRTGIEWGVYGVPETFVIDAEGKIRHKHVGPLMARDVEGLKSIIEDLRAEESPS